MQHTHTHKQPTNQKCTLQKTIHSQNLRSPSVEVVQGHHMSWWHWPHHKNTQTSAEQVHLQQTGKVLTLQHLTLLAVFVQTLLAVLVLTLLALWTPQWQQTHLCRGHTVRVICCAEATYWCDAVEILLNGSRGVLGCHSSLSLVGTGTSITFVSQK